MSVDDERRRTELLELRSQIIGAARDLVTDDDDPSELSGGAGDPNPADQARESHDRELDESLEENAEQLVHEIDVALRRIGDGTYGTCARCGEPIPEERLEAVPYATLCLGCRRLEERG